MMCAYRLIVLSRSNVPIASTAAVDCGSCYRAVLDSLNSASIARSINGYAIQWLTST